MSKMMISRRQAMGAGALALPALSLAGCQAGAGSGTVDVVMAQGVSGLIIHEIARQQGYFESLKVDPRVLLVSDGGKCVAALVSGAAKVCAWSGFNQVVPAIEKGARLKILAGGLTLPSLAMYSGRPEIRQVQDLEGKVIGIGAPGSVVHQMTVLLLKKRGVDPSKAQFRNVGSNADILKAVAARTIDAGLSDVDVSGEQDRFGIHMLPDGLLWKAIPEYVNQATYASDAAIGSSRDAIVRVLAAYASAYRFVSQPQSQAAFVKARQTVTGAADTKRALTAWNWIQAYQPYDLNLTLTDQQIDYVQQVNLGFGVQSQALPVSQIADMSLARDALRLVK